MVKPGMNQVALIVCDLRKPRIRPDAIAPNSPRDNGVGVVIPRAIKPDWVSKSNVRQTICRAIAAGSPMLAGIYAHEFACRDRDSACRPGIGGRRRTRQPEIVAARVDDQAVRSVFRNQD